MIENDFDLEIPENPQENSQAPAQPQAQAPSTASPEASQDTAIDLPDVEVGTKAEGPAFVVEPDAKEVAVKFGIIGAGQGGNRLADTFYQIGYRRVCAINTTPQDFLGLSLPTDRQRVLEASEGGAGKDPDIGKKALPACTDKL